MKPYYTVCVSVPVELTDGTPSTLRQAGVVFATDAVEAEKIVKPRLQEWVSNYMTNPNRDCRVARILSTDGEYFTEERMYFGPLESEDEVGAS